MKQEKGSVSRYPKLSSLWRQWLYCSSPKHTRTCICPVEALIDKTCDSIFLRGWCKEYLSAHCKSITTRPTSLPSFISRKTYRRSSMGHSPCYRALHLLLSNDPSSPFGSVFSQYPSPQNLTRQPHRPGSQRPLP